MSIAAMGQRWRCRHRAPAAAPLLGVAIIATVILFPLLVRAHATLESPTAVAGAYHKAVVRVPHGCEGSPTIAVTVSLPAGVTGAKPQPKPGWEISTRREALAEPFRDGHGKTVTDRVSEVTWRGGRLDDAHYDEFAIHVRLPNRPGETIYLPVFQRCETGEHRWAETPEPGQRPGSLRSPAPSLLLLPRS